jgi:hypothetical protein
MDGILTPVRSSLSSCDRGTDIDAGELCHGDGRSLGARPRASNRVAVGHWARTQVNQPDRSSVPASPKGAALAQGERSGGSGDVGLSGTSGATSVLEFDGPIRDDQPEGCPNCTIDEADFAPMGADQFGRDRKSQTGTPGAG